MDIETPLERKEVQEQVHFLLENGDVHVDYDGNGDLCLQITMPYGEVDEEGWRKITMASVH